MAATYEGYAEHVAGKDTDSYLGLRLQCPRCRTDVSGRKCERCCFVMECSDGILRALPPERRAHYAQFIADYEHIRASEGRGSQQESYYLGLPYKDTTGHNDKQWKIRTRSFDYLLRHLLKAERGCKTVLDLGAGNCWMSYRLTQAGYQPTAVDLLVNDQDGLGAALHYERELRESLPRCEAELAHLPFQSEQFDAAIFNASFHYAEDFVATLREALRCVKRNGMVIISDTPWYSRDESGKQMVEQRQAYFRQRFDTASDSIRSQEYLTDDRLRSLESALGIRFVTHTPWYGFQWAMRPWIARLRRRREPSRFRIYVARNNA